MELRRVTVVARSLEDETKCVALLHFLGLETQSRSPDLVLCHGGDGALLRAERIHPTVPKLPIQAGQIGYLCQGHSLGDAISLLRAGNFKRSIYTKIRVTTGSGFREGLNEAVVRNAFPTEALRFSITIDGVSQRGLWIGDGIVVATPFGSSGYFYSITKQQFVTGLGLAFNNVTRDAGPLILRESAKIRCRLARGEAVVVTDNDRAALALRQNDEVLIERSPNIAEILRLDPIAQPVRSGPPPIPSRRMSSASR